MAEDRAAAARSPSLRDSRWPTMASMSTRGRGRRVLRGTTLAQPASALTERGRPWFTVAACLGVMKLHRRQ
eukprot:9496066-Pyramimonas_sp.AAC.1